MKKWLKFSIAYLIISFSFVVMLTGIFYKSLHWEIEGSLPFWQSFMTYFEPWKYAIGFIWIACTVYMIFDDR
jgi:hypothetical protein